SCWKRLESFEELSIEFYRLEVPANVVASLPTNLKDLKLTFEALESGELETFARGLLKFRQIRNIVLKFYNSAMIGFVEEFCKFLRQSRTLKTLRLRCQSCVISFQEILDIISSSEVQCFAMLAYADLDLKYGKQLRDCLNSKKNLISFFLACD